ncbi:VOC family protein [candidate division KSB1 bacterium]|nr:VOC family protein [candidate division KSB1 bacterium]
MKAKIEHIAMWVKDIEKMRLFYETYFGCSSASKYVNDTGDFCSYFLSFKSGARLELMNHSKITNFMKQAEPLGFSHLAISIGSKDEVNQLTKTLKAAGYKIISDPRMTGDGYYESVFLDPENNKVELTI